MVYTSRAVALYTCRTPGRYITTCKVPARRIVTVTCIIKRYNKIVFMCASRDPLIERKEKEYLLGEVVFVIMQFIQRVRKEVARPACRQIFDTVANT